MADTKPTHPAREGWISDTAWWIDKFCTGGTPEDYRAAEQIIDNLIATVIGPLEAERDRLAEALKAEQHAHTATAIKAAGVNQLAKDNEALLAIYHAANCLVGQADADSTVATVLTPALVAFERLHDTGSEDT